MSKTKADIAVQLRDWASTICTVNSHVPPSSKAKMARDAADEIDRLRARVAELEDIIAGKKPLIDGGES